MATAVSDPEEYIASCIERGATPAPGVYHIDSTIYIGSAD